MKCFEAIKLQNFLLSTFFLTHSGTYNAMQNYLFTEKEKRLIFVNI